MCSSVAGSTTYYTSTGGQSSQRETMTGSRPELQGSYKYNFKPGYLKVEQDGKVIRREEGMETFENIKLEYGDFKPAEDVVREASGRENYNFNLIVNDGDENSESIFGIVSDDGESLYFLDKNGTGVDVFPRITEEKAAELGWFWVN